LSTYQLLPKLAALKDEDVRTSYQEVCKAYHAIDDFRAKLLGFLPLVSGVGIFFLLNDAFTNATKRSSTAPFLVVVGIFGFVAALGLFSYELHAVRRCRVLIKVGTGIEGRMGIGGQFWHRPDDIAGFIGPALAACLIYPAVLGAWIYVTFIFVWPLVALVLAPLVFLIGFVASSKSSLKDVTLTLEEKNYIIVSRFEIKPQHRQDFIDAALKDGRDSLHHEQGARRFEIVEDESDPNSFYLSEAYEDKEAFDAHTKGCFYQDFFDTTKGYYTQTDVLVKGTLKSS